MKMCKKCNVVKSKNDFKKDSRLKDGYRNVCKECSNDNKRIYKLKCELCEIEFENKYKNRKYCSDECARKSHSEKMSGENNHKYNSVKAKCSQCDKDIIVTKSKYENQNNFCSKECYFKHKSANMIGEKNHFYGKNVTDEHKAKISATRKARGVAKGDKNPAYNSVEVKCSNCGKNKIIPKNEFENYNKHFCDARCKAIFQCDDNITDYEREQRRSIYKLVVWRINVFKRDSYTCNICGLKGGKINAHHLNGYNWDKENRFNVNNGITLCVNCHKHFHKIYGKGGNTKEQFEIYKNDYSHGNS